VSDFPTEADCVIVGGGVMGCSLAYHLAVLGMKPVILEKGQLGQGSTAKCAGGVRQQFGTEVNCRLGKLSIEMMKRFEAEVGVSADLRQIGYLILASGDQEAKQFASNVDLQHQWGIDDVEFLSRDKIAEHCDLALNLEGITAATWCPSDGLAGPNEITSGYANAARKLGTSIFEEAEVTSIEAAGAQFAVGTAQGTVTADRVVNCAGAYARKIGAMAGVEVPVRPYRRHVFITEPMDLPPDVPMGVDFHTSFYCHPEGPGLLLGMSDRDEHESFDTATDWGFLERMVETASHRLPKLADAAIKSGWAGLYEITPDHQAIVGEMDELKGFWCCCGFSGHGFMQAPAVGKVLAQMMVGEPAAIDLSALAPNRFAGKLVPEYAVI
jgi:sarcosine oxidase subunit beta